MWRVVSRVSGRRVLMRRIGTPISTRHIALEPPHRARLHPQHNPNPPRSGPATPFFFSPSTHHCAPYMGASFPSIVLTNTLPLRSTLVERTSNFA